MHREAKRKWNNTKALLKTKLNVHEACKELLIAIDESDTAGQEDTTSGKRYRPLESRGSFTIRYERVIDGSKKNARMRFDVEDDMEHRPPLTVIKAYMDGESREEELRCVPDVETLRFEAEKLILQVIEYHRGRLQGGNDE